MSKKVFWNPDFAPSYTPKEMLDMGIMMDCYYFNATSGLPGSILNHPKVNRKGDTPDASKNYYGVKSRTSLKQWQRNGAIRTDKAGWIEWYCKYYLGRRLGEEDEWQIGRWRSFVARHNAQVQAKCKKGDVKCNTKQRQGLLQWAWDSDTVFNDKQLERNLERLQKVSSGLVILDNSKLQSYLNW